MTLRSHFITRWNRHCSRILQSMLPILEGYQSSPSHDCYDQLAEINVSYQVRTTLVQDWLPSLCHSVRATGPVGPV